MKVRTSAIADGHPRLDSINFERPLRGRQFEKLTEYNVPVAELNRLPPICSKYDRHNTSCVSGNKLEMVGS